MALHNPLGIEDLLARNAAWARKMEASTPGFFRSLAEQQTPKHLWIGCSDSRVPANEIVGLQPGELFVHRNVANLVQLADLNCLAVVQFAVDVLKIEHIIVCGHYGCSGVRAAFRGERVGLADHWIRPVRDICQDHDHELAALGTDERRLDRLCELNVLRQVRNLLQTQIVHDAWARRQKLAIHPVIYGLQDGLLRQLTPPITESNRAAALPAG
ncbi:MAG: carbonate dehydratase [Alphaproteobacteria bacterium]|nr:carbonate dehydratase [Alphaproteobacteria bacterium]